MIVSVTRGCGKVMERAMNEVMKFMNMFALIDNFSYLSYPVIAC